MEAELDAAAAELQALAQQLQRALDELAARGALTEQAVLEARRAFDAQVLVLMARHMRAVPGQVSGMWDVRAVAAMPVGEVTLSQALYANARQVAREAGAIVRQHAQGVQQSRELALRLYDGYDPKDGLRRPLEGTARARLPKALRQLTADAADRASLQRVFDLGMRYAATLKTAPLKAAYMEALRGWEDQQGAQALRRRLAVAVREKSRFMANRIAQTELARAHQHALADELMADASIEVVQVVLSGSHPRRDICDLHARADLFGLGPGCYPKARAPRPTFHPFCRCRLRSRPDLSASMARTPRGGEEAAQRAWLRELPEGEAAQVMGSRSLLQQVLTGADPVEIVNRGVPQAYRTVRLGEAVQNDGMRQHPQALPRLSEAVIPDSKIAGYVLNQAHDVGGHKARLFASVLGITAENAHLLVQAIRSGLPLVPAITRGTDRHGEKLQADIEVTGPKGRATVRTGWIVREQGGVAQLTTAIVLRSKR